MKIDSNIPMPVQYVFGQMKVGDSFLVPAHIKREAVAVSAMRYGNKHGMKFTVRKTSEGYRCWRVK